MLIISNKNIPEHAIKQLQKYGKVLPFETKGITYPAISGHPDVFLCFTDKRLIIAPNTPGAFRKLLIENNVIFVEGQSKVGNKYPETATYNAVVTKNYLIHNLKITDNKIEEICADKKAIHVNQAYTRCNLLPLKNDSFITSDKGIFHTLSANKLNVLYVNPKGIILSGFNHGFFGGACGIYQNQIFTIGSINKSPDGKKIVPFLKNLDYQIIELYNGQLFDGGSLIFID